MKFEELGLSETILKAVRAEGYEIATPIQIQAIPHLLKGRDLMGCAQTGTGKTAAFALPTLQRLAARLAELQNKEAGSQASMQEAPVRDDRGNGPQRGPQQRGPQAGHRTGPARRIRALILSPTRELAAQIGESFRVYGQFAGLRHSVVFGGVSQVPQVRDLRFGIDILVATPGRLLDLMDQGYIDLSHVEILILDEADQMLDMGFIVPLRNIVSKVPKRRQTLMFSATMPTEIRQLAAEWLHDPINIQVAAVSTPAEKVKQSVFFVEPRQKPYMLSHFLKQTPHTRTLVFSRTKHGADKIVKHLNRDGIRAEAIHGNKSQGARQRVLQQFKSDKPPVLVATDIAARGLDIDAISHVINFDIPEVAETYVHRIGRTARAGAEGIAISFCGREERILLRQIERLIRLTIPSEKPPVLEMPQGDQDQRPRHPAGPQAANTGHGARRHPASGAAGTSVIGGMEATTDERRPLQHQGGQARRPFSSGERGQRPQAASRPGKRRRFGSSSRP